MRPDLQRRRDEVIARDGPLRVGIGLALILPLAAIGVSQRMWGLMLGVSVLSLAELAEAAAWWGARQRLRHPGHPVPDAEEGDDERRGAPTHDVQGIGRLTWSEDAEAWGLRHAFAGEPLRVTLEGDPERGPTPAAQRLWLEASARLDALHAEVIGAMQRDCAQKKVTFDAANLAWDTVHVHPTETVHGCEVTVGLTLATDPDGTYQVALQGGRSQGVWRDT